MKLKIFFCLLILLSFSLILSEEVSGDIDENTTWSGQIDIVGDVNLLTDYALEILPGTHINFTGEFTLTIYGIINSTGTATDSIYFYSTDNIWNQIRIENTPDSDEINSFSHCQFRNADTAVKIIESPVTIQNCSFQNMGDRAIDVFGIGSTDLPPVQIINSQISHCQRHGIFVVEHDNTIIENCDISYCALDESPRGAVQLSNQSNNGFTEVSLVNNHIHNNIWQGITAFDITGQGNINLIATDNLIETNLTGIYLLQANGSFINNTIRNNFEEGNANSGAGVMISGASSNPLFSQNTITGNYTAFYIVQDAGANLGNLENDDTEDNGYNRIYNNIDMSGNNNSVYSLTSSDIKAENNNWGTTDSEEIATTIHDGNDQAGLGIVDFEPFQENITYLSGHYFENLTLSQDSIFVIGNVYMHNYDLAVQAGVNLIFEDNTNIFLHNGSIEMTGDSADSIRVSNFNEESTNKISVSNSISDGYYYDFINCRIENINLIFDSEEQDFFASRLLFDQTNLQNVFLQSRSNFDSLKIINNSFDLCQIEINHTLNDFNFSENQILGTVDFDIAAQTALIQANQFLEETNIESLEIDANLDMVENEFTGVTFNTPLHYQNQTYFINNKLINNTIINNLITVDNNVYFNNNLLTNNNFLENIIHCQNPASENIKISNNLFAGNLLSNPIIYLYADSAVDVILANNSFYNNSNVDLIFSESDNISIQTLHNNSYDFVFSYSVNVDIENEETNSNYEPNFIDSNEEMGNTENALNSDWHLNACDLINSGHTDTSGLHLPEFDLDGNPRIFPGTTQIIDVGPYEYQDNVSIGENNGEYASIELIGNYPNPFGINTKESGGTNISFQLNQKTNNAKIEIFNIKGQIVKKIPVNSEPLPQKISWNGLNKNGKKVSSGIYFYCLKTDNSRSKIKKMLLIN